MRTYTANGHPSGEPLVRLKDYRRLRRKYRELKQWIEVYKEFRVFCDPLGNWWSAFNRHKEGPTNERLPNWKRAARAIPRVGGKSLRASDVSGNLLQ